MHESAELEYIVGYDFPLRSVLEHEARLQRSVS